MRAFLRDVAHILSGIFQELSDQRAYRTYLEWHGLAHSPAEWRRFSDQRWAAQARRGRCC
jgi:hypothetical protein